MRQKHRWGSFLVSAVALVAASSPAVGAAATHAAAPACTFSQLIANSAQRVGADKVRITLINDGPKACVLQGFPGMALAGQGSPNRNKPLKVVRQGTAKPVNLAVGGKAWTLIGFTPVLGEAEGYCASGAKPSVAPSIVLGVGGGGLQLGPDDGGDFALCGDTVRATAFAGSR
ncbi:DUF4232 domain-containing protein [Streptomyces sp. NRRL B-24572]|uniref:DUF4232 domain-containing protein n=1 Tax=Streptomyces sp. NRRL B-24572 TaxID=1962156 RepID=UPI000A384EB1|nr:DUF4232 domain-containing protein [Streptomyces sp. NRRL B-24572]